MGKLNNPDVLQKQILVGHGSFQACKSAGRVAQDSGADGRIAPLATDGESGEPLSKSEPAPPDTKTPQSYMASRVFVYRDLCTKAILLAILAWEPRLEVNAKVDTPGHGISGILSK